MRSVQQRASLVGKRSANFSPECMPVGADGRPQRLRAGPAENLSVVRTDCIDKVGSPVAAGDLHTGHLGVDHRIVVGQVVLLADADPAFH